MTPTDLLLEAIRDVAEATALLRAKRERLENLVSLAHGSPARPPGSQAIAKHSHSANRD